MKLPYAEVKFYLKVISQTGLSSLQVSCKLAASEARIKQELVYLQHFDQNNISEHVNGHENSYVNGTTFESSLRSHGCLQ